MLPDEFWPTQQIPPFSGDSIIPRCARCDARLLEDLILILETKSLLVASVLHRSLAQRPSDGLSEPGIWRLKIMWFRRKSDLSKSIRRTGGLAVHPTEIFDTP
jgi:hypothetical protein